MAEVDAKEYFDLVKHEFFTLRIEWRLYRSLFGTNRETVDLLNEVSGPTAHTLERVLFERCLLGLRRLTDNVQGRRGRSRSVTIKGLPEHFGSKDGELRRRVGIAVSNASFARKWSDKRIAHADLDYRQGRAVLEKASREKVEIATDSIASVLKWVAAEYFEQSLVTHPIPASNDERRFLEALYLGQAAISEDEQHRRTLLAERRHRELRELPRPFERFPEWLSRKDPPLDTD